MNACVVYSPGDSRIPAVLKLFNAHLKSLYPSGKPIEENLHLSLDQVENEAMIIAGCNSIVAVWCNLAEDDLRYVACIDGAIEGKSLKDKLYPSMKYEGTESKVSFYNRLSQLLELIYSFACPIRGNDTDEPWDGFSLLEYLGYSYKARYITNTKIDLWVSDNNLCFTLPERGKNHFLFGYTVGALDIVRHNISVATHNFQTKKDEFSTTKRWTLFYQGKLLGSFDCVNRFDLYKHAKWGPDLFRQYGIALPFPPELDISTNVDDFLEGRFALKACQC